MYFLSFVIFKITIVFKKNKDKATRVSLLKLTRPRLIKESSLCLCVSVMEKCKLSKVRIKRMETDSNNFKYNIF